MEGTPQQPSVPPNWYPDPDGEGLRYWDGTAWTTHTAPAVAPAEPAAESQAPTQPAASQAPATQPAAAHAPPTSRGQQAPPTSRGQQAPPTSSGKPAVSATAAGDRSGRPTTLEWVLSIGLPIVPLIGLIWGLYLRNQGDAKQNPGNVAILLSLAVVLIAVLTLR